MIRFGVVLTVVLAAMGLLAGGVLANRLLLVYLAIGAAALAAIMLTAGVLIWREEVFGPSSAARASPAAQQAASPSPVLAATGVAQPGRSARSAADDITRIGAAVRDELVVEPPPPALPSRPEGTGRPEPQGYPGWPAPLQPQEQPDRLQRSDWPKRPEHPDRARPSDRPEQPDWPEPVAEPVPGPRRGHEPVSGRVPPASSGAATADELGPRPAREPAAQSQGGRDADVAAWSFFTTAADPLVARPDLTQVVGAEAGAAGSGESGEPGGSHEADESPQAARMAEAAAPDAGRPPVTVTAEGEDRAAAAPDAAEPVSAAADQPAPDDAAVAGPEAEDESPVGTPIRDPDTEVTVVPGITRYHRSQCILIRFLGPEDLQTMTLQAAEMASCVPCRACRPEQVLASDSPPAG